MPLCSRDLFGVLRGRCNEPGCECKRYTILRLSESDNLVRCEYCDHVPNAHGKICDLETKNAAEAKAQCNVPGTVFEDSVSDETVEACTSSLSSVQYAVQVFTWTVNTNLLTTCMAETR
ncbi:uncharacterized protein LOC142582419 isoform X1 [Dermacentor variabilis]|uniref:uncharacterized protein LOC142582419 isoform X1 n=1 Tax=Dermacentor variabilis TaxID=34621 RepID=UPI003F5C1527